MIIAQNKHHKYQPAVTGGVMDAGTPAVSFTQCHSHAIRLKQQKIQHLAFQFSRSLHHRNSFFNLRPFLFHYIYLYNRFQDVDLENISQPCKRITTGINQNLATQDENKYSTENGTFYCILHHLR